jgi:hypothetical protein
LAEPNYPNIDKMIFRVRAEEERMEEAERERERERERKEERGSSGKLFRWIKGLDFRREPLFGDSF